MLDLVIKSPASTKAAGTFLASLTTPAGRHTQRQALVVIARICGFSLEEMPWAQLRYEHTQFVRAELAQKYAPATANRFLSAMRRVLKECWRLGYMTAEDFQRACDISPIIGETVPAGRGLDSDEILLLMDACHRDTTPAGARDAAVIGILYMCGLRRAELSGLDLADLEPKTGALKILGKRRKERMAYVVGGAWNALEDWLRIRGNQPGAIFHPVNLGGIIVPVRLSAQAIYVALRKRAKEADVKRFSPHDLRRSFVSDLLDAGADLVTVAKMAGHSNVETTARYDRRPERAKQKAAGLLHLPYTSRNSL
jgi:site-specific recombinase XerD